MDQLEEFEVKVFEVTGDTRVAENARLHMQQAIDAGLITMEDVANIEIDYKFHHVTLSKPEGETDGDGE